MGLTAAAFPCVPDRHHGSKAMADYTFFTNPMSRGQIARWALHEAGADYEQVIVEYGQPKPLPCWPPTRWASCPR
jgi:hypothetical protein